MNIKYDMFMLSKNVKTTIPYQSMIIFVPFLRAKFGQTCKNCVLLHYFDMFWGKYNWSQYSLSYTCQIKQIDLYKNVPNSYLHALYPRSCQMALVLGVSENNFVTYEYTAIIHTHPTILLDMYTPWAKVKGILQFSCRGCSQKFLHLFVAFLQEAHFHKGIMQKIISVWK